MTTTAQPQLRLVDVTVDIGPRRVLDGVSLSVESGEWLAVVGPNGAGKTSLLRAIAGLVAAHGRIELDGRPADRLSRRARARRVALVHQSPLIPAAMTVLDYVLLGRTPHLGLFATDRPIDHAVTREVLEQLDLVGLALRAIDTLSGGERQRVLLARALAQQSAVLLLDEPTTALDIGHQQEVLELVDKLRYDRGLAVVSAMHDLTVAAQYADRMALLARGRVVAVGTGAEVLTEERLLEHYGATVRVLHEPEGIVVVPARMRGDRS